jgi:hypothetical protein
MENASTSLSPGELEKVGATGPSLSGTSCSPMEIAAASGSHEQVHVLERWELADDSILNIGFEDFHTFTDAVNWMPTDLSSTTTSSDFAAGLQAINRSLSRNSLQEEEHNLPCVGAGFVASPCLGLSPLNASSNSSTATNGAVPICRVEKMYTCRTNGCSASFVERRQLE